MMTRTQISTGVSARTRAQADELTQKLGYSLRDLVTLAIDRMYRKEFEMNKQDLITVVSRLVTTPATKDFTTLEDWIIEGDTDNMTPEEIAAEWDELPAMETDN